MYNEKERELNWTEFQKKKKTERKRNVPFMTVNTTQWNLVHSWYTLYKKKKPTNRWPMWDFFVIIIKGWYIIAL